MDWSLIFGGLIFFPFYIHLCAKIAARAWFHEKRRYMDDFMKEPN